MSLTYQFRPISVWPGKPTPNNDRRRATFSAGWTATLRLLEAELGHLNGRNVVIEANCDQADIRLDGMLRSGAKLRGPGVIISFGSRVGALRYPCDTFWEWQDNVRAIALALEALRKVERYGVTKRNEQYQGWAALPPPASIMFIHTADEAARWLSEYLRTKGADTTITAAKVLLNFEDYAFAFRTAAKYAHPDRNGGMATLDWDWLMKAKTLLDAKHEGGRR